jgi:hypothetical protein
MTALFRIFANSSITDTALQRRPEILWTTKELLLQSQITLSFAVEFQVSCLEIKVLYLLATFAYTISTHFLWRPGNYSQLYDNGTVMHCALPTQSFPTSPDDVYFFHECPSVDSLCLQLCIITYSIALKNWAREYLLDLNMRHSSFILKIDWKKTWVSIGLHFNSFYVQVHLQSLPLLIEARTL